MSPCARPPTPLIPPGRCANARVRVWDSVFGRGHARNRYFPAMFFFLRAGSSGANRLSFFLSAQFCG